MSMLQLTGQPLRSIGSFCGVHISQNQQKESDTITNVMVMKLNSVTETLFTMKIQYCCRCKTKANCFIVQKSYHSICVCECNSSSCSIFFFCLCFFFLLSSKMEISMLTRLHIPLSACIQRVVIGAAHVCVWVLNFTTSIQKQQKKSPVTTTIRVFPEKIFTPLLTDYNPLLLFFACSNRKTTTTTTMFMEIHT